MTELDRILLKIEIEGIKELLDFHAKEVELLGMTSEKQAHIDDILDILNDYLKELKQDGNNE